MLGLCPGFCIAAPKLVVVGKLAYAHWHCCCMAVSRCGMCQSEQTHFWSLFHGAPATMQYATVGSNVAVLYAIAAAACHTEQTPL